MRISDWSSDVCSSDLVGGHDLQTDFLRALVLVHHAASFLDGDRARSDSRGAASRRDYARHHLDGAAAGAQVVEFVAAAHEDERVAALEVPHSPRSEERSVGTECVSTCLSRGYP